MRPIDGKLVPGLRSAFAGSVRLTAAQHKVCGANAIQLTKMPLARFGPLLFGFHTRPQGDSSRGGPAHRRRSTSGSDAD
jgi:hypothetical protein